MGGLHHIAVSTPDIERITAFYHEALGFERESEITCWKSGTTAGGWVDDVTGLKNSSGRAVMLRKGNIRIEFFEFESPKPTLLSDRRVCDYGYTHICLTVDDMDAEYKRLKDAGMGFHARPPKNPLGGLRAIYGRDPDGNVIELLEVSPRSCWPTLIKVKIDCN